MSRFDLRLRPVTAAGCEFVERCEGHVCQFRAHAAAHDRDRSFPFENFDEMRASSVMLATAPAEFGGPGVTAIQDLVAGVSPVANGDASTRWR